MNPPPSSVWGKRVAWTALTSDVISASRSTGTTTATSSQPADMQCLVMGKSRGGSHDVDRALMRCFPSRRGSSVAVAVAMCTPLSHTIGPELIVSPLIRLRHSPYGVTYQPRSPQATAHWHIMWPGLATHSRFAAHARQVASFSEGRSPRAAQELPSRNAGKRLQWSVGFFACRSGIAAASLGRRPSRAPALRTRRAK